MTQTNPPPDASMPQPGYPPHDSDRLSQVALWSMILGIVGVCIPLTALPALIMGIVGIATTGAGKLRGQGFAVAGTVLGALGLFGSCLWIGIMLPALGAARQTAMELKSSTQLRSIGQAMTVYASSNDGRFPPADRAFEILLDEGLLAPEILVSPLEDGDGVSYILTGLGEQSFSATEILAYEDPKHMDGGVHVLFGDGIVQSIPHERFEEMLAEQERQRPSSP